MKNGDMPAMPSLSELGDIATSQGGLTKREYFAGLAMQSLVGGGLPPEYAAPRALEFADTLLEELEKTK